MPFIPHTDQDVAAMLSALGAGRIDELFDEIPEALRASSLPDVPPACSEMQISRLMHGRAARDGELLNFAGAGAYDHHVPAAVWEIAGRGEFYSAYTPYQAEASQGTLQLIYEYQSMMAALMAMDVSNASLYDGASALAEAVLMAVRANRGSRARTVVLPRTLHPTYAKVARTIAGGQRIRFVDVEFDRDSGAVPADALRCVDEELCAVVIQQPNFFGRLEDVDALTDAAHARGALVIAVVNPVAMALLRPPGEWGREGADIACGEGQPLGVPLSSGGPYFGFMTTREAHLRQMPGRLVGRTLDADGRSGYTLTLQAREQHIRRSRATSNICTNQGLMVTAATVHMALLGGEGLRRVAAHSHAAVTNLVEALCALPGVTRVFDGPHFHEALLRLPCRAGDALAALAARGILGGVAPAALGVGADDELLVCATETRSDDDIRQYADALAQVLREECA